MQLQPPDVIWDEYDLLHDCITLEEVRWLLRRIPRYSQYWMYFLLRAVTGIRPDEALKLTLYHLSTDCRTISYRVDKASTKLSRSSEYVQKRKHRRIILDEWVRLQLVEYLNRHCRIVDGTYVSPYEGQRLFPWKNLQVVGVYWYKLRLQMHDEGYDSLRVIREFHRSQTREHTYVVRPHILRHFAASVMYYKLGMDIKAVMLWIKHNDAETTNGYLHSAEALGTTREYLIRSSWQEILGYDEGQDVLHEHFAPSQTCLDSFE